MTYLKYLSKLDLLYKYKYKNFNCISKLQKVTLQFPLIQIKETLSNLIYMDKTAFTGHLSVEIRAFCIFYLIFYMYPYITYKSVNAINLKNYALKLNISYKSKLDQLLHILFLNFFSRSENPSILFFKNNYKNISSFYLRISLSSIIDSNLLFKKIFNSLKSKNFNIYIKFYIKNLDNTTNITKNKIKNLIFLWSLK